MTFEQIRQYIKGVINGIDFNSHISPMPAEDMSEVVSPLPSVMNRKFKYSTEEQIVGEWIDGKPLYQKTVDCGTLTNATVQTGKDVAHNISNTSVFISTSGVWISNALSGTVPYADSNYQLGAYARTDNSNVHLDYKGNWSSTHVYITLQYTKTTD